MGLSSIDFKNSLLAIKEKIHFQNINGGNSSSLITNKNSSFVPFDYRYGTLLSGIELVI